MESKVADRGTRWQKTRVTEAKRRGEHRGQAARLLLPTSHLGRPTVTTCGRRGKWEQSRDGWSIATERWKVAKTHVAREGVLEDLAPN